MVEKTPDPRVGNASPPRVDFKLLPEGLIVESEPPKSMYIPPDIIPSSTVQNRRKQGTASIADRVKSRRHQNSVKAEDSITARVARWCCELANPMLDKETGELLKYHVLLKHLQFRKAWNLSVSIEFGCLGQGIKDTT